MSVVVYIDFKMVLKAPVSVSTRLCQTVKTEKQINLASGKWCSNSSDFNSPVNARRNWTNLSTVSNSSGPV